MRSLTGLAMNPQNCCKTIYLIRHGQGTHNVAGEKDRKAYLSAEHEDACLTPAGWNQAFSVRQHLFSNPYVGCEVDLVVTSPMMRTMETACAIFGGEIALSVNGQICQRPLLMHSQSASSEIHSVSAVGCRAPFVANELCREKMGKLPCDKRSSVSKYKAIFPAIDFSEIESDEDIQWQPDYRETSSDIGGRAAVFTKWLLCRPESKIAVVSHSGFLWSFTERLSSEFPEKFGKYTQERFSNCELRTVLFTDKSGGIPAYDYKSPLNYDPTKD